MMSRTRDLAVLFGTFAVAVLVALSSGCRREATASAPATSRANSAATRTVSVPVDGMICQVCAGGLKATLKDVPGVQDVEVSLEKRNAVVRYQDGKVNVDQLRRAIANLGLKPGTPTPVHQ